jgi:uncharacterized integral membrane protein
MKPMTIVILVLVALFVIILVQNTQVVTLRLLFWKLGMSQIILVPLTMLIGFIIGYLVAKVTGGNHGTGERE